MLSRVQPMNTLLRDKLSEVLIVFRAVNRCGNVLLWLINKELIALAAHPTGTRQTNFVRILDSSNVNRGLIRVDLLIDSNMSEGRASSWISSDWSPMLGIRIAFNNLLLEFGEHTRSWGYSLICTTTIWSILLRDGLDLMCNIVPIILHVCELLSS